MLKRFWHWLKKTFRRLFGSKAIPQPAGEQKPVEPPKQPIDYEYLFFQLLAGVDAGWNRGDVKGFLLARNIKEADLLAWLRGFGERLLASSAENEELARRLVRLRDLGMGELGNVGYEIGVRLLERGETNRRDAEDAEEEFTTDEAEAWFNRGYEQGMAGDFAGAIASWDKALEFKPDYYEAWNNRGVALVYLGEYEQAVASYDKALEFKPDYHQAWKNRGSALVYLGEYEKAIASYDKVLEIKPDDHEAWYNRGVALDNLGEYEQAVASFDKALKIKSDFHQARFNQGNALDNLGEYEQAVASFDKALEIKPDDHQAWFNRGNALGNLGQDEQAVVSWDKALEIKPDDHQAWFNRGVALNKLGQYEQAVASYDKALEIKPDYYEAWNGRGVVLCDNLGQDEQALASFDKALEFKPDFHQAWHNRGIALGHLGQYEQAVASFDKALEFKPDFHQAWINRGIVAGKSVSCDRFLSLWSTIARNNHHLNKRGYEGKLASYEEGLKYCQPNTHPEGWGLLHQFIGNAHYFQGHASSHPRTYWYKAVNSYNQALKTLTVTDFPELHLEVLRDLINVRLHLCETAKVEELQRQGTDVLRRLLNECQSPGKKKQLALKFAGFQQFTVDLVVQSGNWCAALELAEKGKNACLSWLLDSWSNESPKLPEIQQLLNPKTAIVYWHLSPYALHTFILTHNHQPIILAYSQSPAQRLLDFEKWAETWNEEYSNYRKGKDNECEKTATWRDNLPAMLQRLGEILDIAVVVNVINNQERLNIQNLILIPHRDLHRFPLHALFPNNFTITYLPSAKIGITLKTLQSTNVENIHELPLLSVEYPDSKGYDPLEFAQVESEFISRMFTQHTRKSSEQATKAAVIEALPQNSIFHFTGHGEYNFEHPTFSNLALAGEEKLTVEDICNFDLTNYQLISLAACETAITGNRTITAEYIGLVSGFMAAGVRHVVSTLWTVESEATALVMIQFYQLLQQGKTAVVALAEATQWLQNITAEDLATWYAAEMAKLPEDEDIIRQFLSDHSEIIKNTPNSKYQPYNHPYFWAAFTITGNSPS